MRIGIVGIGFMGMIHYLAARKVRGSKVAAVCTRDEKKLRGDWRGIRGNFGPPGERMDLSGVKAYRDYAEMLADPDIDLVDICLPTKMHPSAASAALAAGKHVLLEKPIALDPADGRKLVAAAAKAKRMLMVAQVLPFFPEWAFAVETARTGKLGKLLAGHFRRIISRPDWRAGGDAAAEADAEGGPAVDLHVHDTHFIQLLAGVPEKVFSRGVTGPAGGVVEHLETTYLYGDGGPVISSSCGRLSPAARPFVHSYELFFEKGALVLDAGGLTLLEGGKTRSPKLSGPTSGDPIDTFAVEIKAAVSAAETGKECPELSAAGALTALTLCHKELESIRTGRAVAIR